MVLLELYWSFLLIGFSSFGGLSMIPQISEQVLQHEWMTASQVTDIVAIAEMTPGPLGLNCATFAGMQAAGIPGAIASNLGALTPSLTLCALAAAFFVRFQDSKVLKYILTGVRPACLAVVAALVISMAGSNYIDVNGVKYLSIVISLLDMYLLVRKKWSVPLVIVFSAVLGILLFGIFKL